MERIQIQGSITEEQKNDLIVLKLTDLKNLIATAETDGKSFRIDDLKALQDEINQAIGGLKL